jgi:transcriptional regulator with XRE-family HTH domain
MSNFGTRLKAKRLAQSLTQKTLADAVGVTGAAVSMWESNGDTAISAVAALKLSQRLNVNPFWLVFGQGGPTDKIEVPHFSKLARKLARKIDRLPNRERDAVDQLLKILHT